MLAHNQRYEAGEVTWWRKVTKHYDMTLEEIERDLGLGNYPHMTLLIDIDDDDVICQEERCPLTRQHRLTPRSQKLSPGESR